MKKSFSLLSLLSLSFALQAESLPGSDILIADLETSKTGVRVSNVKHITQRPGYDNQPYFVPGTNTLLYTSAIAQDEHEQTDIIQYNLDTQKSKNLTRSPESEYSPTPYNDNQYYSVIRVNDQGQQHLWRYPLQAKDKPAQLLSTEPVGYHAWQSAQKLLLFVLGEPHTLQLADLSTDKGEELDKHPGASLYKIPGRELMSYNKALNADEKSWQVMSYHPTTGIRTPLTRLPEGSYHYTWLNGDNLLAANGSELMWKSVTKRDHMAWSKIADLQQACPKGLTRLAVNQQGNRLAMVCNR